MMSSSLSKNLQAASIFKKAALYIRTYGWQVSGMSEHSKPRCSMGALASAHQEQVWDSELALIMYTTLSHALGGIGLTEFNKRASSGNDVALLFERIAYTLENKTTLLKDPNLDLQANFNQSISY